MVFERVLLLLGMPLLRLLMRTWRRRGPEDTVLREMLQAPRVVLATFHGMLLQLAAFRSLPAAAGRRVVVMLSPSLDGRLLAAALAALDIDHVFATTGSRGVAGAREFVRRVEDGDIGVVAVDGPRGPRCVAKRGFLQLAAAARAHLALTTTSSRRGVSFRSWDRAHLPLPFARVEVTLHLLPPPDSYDRRALATVQETLLQDARGMGSSIVPPLLET